MAAAAPALMEVVRSRTSWLVSKWQWSGGEMVVGGVPGTARIQGERRRPWSQSRRAKLARGGGHGGYVAACMQRQVKDTHGCSAE